MDFLDKATILIVDDIPDNLSLMSGLLKDDYRVKIANGGGKAIKIAQSDLPPDLILLDIMMPEIDGYEVCKRLKIDLRTRDIPIIFLTAKAKVEDETYGLELGAVDYITKPISPPILLARVKTQLALKSVQDFLRDQNQFLENEVQKRTAEVMAIQDVTIHVVASLAETRDNDTGNHIRRTQHYVRLLANKLRYHPRFAHFLNDDKTIELLFKSAPLHDIGKVGIPDRILLKPGRFEPEEFEIMKTHTTLGRDAILQAERELGIEIPFLKYAKEIAYSHQEKWDGSGYPEGLSGDDIPISARLMAVADVYDALNCRRIYKSGMPHEKAVAIIIEGKGTHFDPDIVDAFVELQEKFKAVMARYPDSNSDIAKKADYEGAECNAIEKKLAPFAEAQGALIEALKQTLSSEEEGNQPVVELNMTKVTEVVQKLAGLLAENDTEACNVLEENLDLLQFALGTEPFSKIDVAIKQYDFETALGHLKHRTDELNIALY